MRRKWLLVSFIVVPLLLAFVWLFAKTRNDPYSIIQVDNYSGRDVHKIRVVSGGKEEFIENLPARASRDLKFILAPNAQIIVSGPDEATGKRFEFSAGADKKELECIRLVLDENCNFSREKGHLFILF